jgi:hypothetical protein
VPCPLEQRDGGYAIPETTLSDLPPTHADGQLLWMPLA